jgi:curved DNA-binding protein
VLGGEARLSTLDGDVSLKIPPGTSSGQVFRLRGKGMADPAVPTQQGDMLATVRVQIPQDLSDQEKSLFEQLARLRRGKVR